MRTYLLLIALVLCLPGCGTDPGTESAASHEEVGTLQLALRGVAPDMQVYRLRHATFGVQGVRYSDFQGVSSTLSSESDLENEVLRSRLFYGSYTVDLRPEGWYLERLTPEGPQRVARAVLLSSPQQGVFVQQGGVSRIAFQFGVDGELIDFQGGDLEIAIDIRQAPDAGVQPMPPLPVP